MGPMGARPSHLNAMKPYRKKDSSIEEEDYEYSNSLNSSEKQSIKNKSKLVQKYSLMNNDDISITKRL